MKRTILSFFVITLLFSFAEPAFAACAPGSNWTAAWTDSFGETTYTIEAPCKVYIGIPFSYTATVTDASYPNDDVGVSWAIIDNGVVVQGGGFNWITTVSGQWQKVINQTYTGVPVDHLLEFKFTDLGGGGGAHWWASNLIGDVTVDPYPNRPPVAEAGPNLFIAGRDQAAAIVNGIATDADGNPLTYRWLEGGVELQSYRPVDASGNAPLDLGSIPPLTPGSHTFILEVSDGTEIAADTVVVSVGNSQPTAAPFAGGTYQAGDDIPLNGSVSDYDGDTLTYRWLEGANVLAQGTVETPSGGQPTDLPEVLVARGLPVGSHTLVLELNDGVNLVTASVTVNVIDTTAPLLAPVASTALLWPPDGKMTEVTINANARDNGSGPPALSVLVTTNVPPRKDNRKKILPDYSITTIDQATGVIVLQVRNSKGRGEDRVYTVAITATDGAGNSSRAVVVIKGAENMGPRSRR